MAEGTNGFHQVIRENSIKALYKIHEKKKIDVILLMLPLVSWKRKEYDEIQKKIAPVVSSLNDLGLEKGENETRS